MEVSSRGTVQLCVSAGEELKLIGSIDGFFPDMGHHIPKEMNGMWLNQIKLLDGFWLRLEDHSTNGEVNTWIRADQFTNHPYGNTFRYGHGLGQTSIRAERFQFSPDGINGCVVKYSFTNSSDSKKDVTCELLARTDLRPVWLSEKIGVYDGKSDSAVFHEKENAFIAKDDDHEWYAAIGSNIVPDSTRSGQFFAAEMTAGNGVSTSMTFSFSFDAWETKELVFYFAGSYKSKEECIIHYRALHDYENLLEKKKQRYDDIASMSEVKTSDENFNEIFGWIKANTDWLMMNVPELGRGVTAGLSEYPFWFGCDGCYTIMGLIATGRFDVAKDTLRVIREASQRHNGNGRIIHEVTSADVLSNAGNTQETAQFILTVWEYFQWTGDLEFIAECFGYMKKSIDWLREMDEDDDGFPSGYGIMELLGMNMELIDTAVYTCIAFDAFEKICILMNEHEMAQNAHDYHIKTKEALPNVFWLSDRGLFADTVTTSQAVEHRLSSLLYQWGSKSNIYREYLKSEIAKKKREEVDNVQSGWLINESWVIATPMEMGLASKEHAEIALSNLHSDHFTGEYGAYLSGLEIPRRTMTISTNVYAAAQARYGYSDRALDLLQRMFSTFSMSTPGSISEMSPDYGCFVQGWTIYCATTIVKYFFGISPDVPQGEINFAPCMPSDWDNGEIKNVRVGEGSISVFFHRKDGYDVFKVENRTGLKINVEKKANQSVEVIDLPVGL